MNILMKISEQLDAEYIEKVAFDLESIKAKASGAIQKADAALTSVIDKGVDKVYRTFNPIPGPMYSDDDLRLKIRAENVQRLAKDDPGGLVYSIADKARFEKGVDGPNADAIRFGTPYKAKAKDLLTSNKEHLSIGRILANQPELRSGRDYIAGRLSSEASEKLEGIKSRIKTNPSFGQRLSSQIKELLGTTTTIRTTSRSGPYEVR